MLEGAGSIRPRSAIGLWKRSHTEQWAQEIIQRIRAGELQSAEGSPAALIAWHRDTNDKLLDTPSVAVELLNVLRPIVAVGRFITYSALALHEYPRAGEQLKAGDEQTRHQFAQEVRRIPQGGGDLYSGHRCLGEGVAVELIEIALRMLTAAMEYEVPAQNLAVDLSDLPAAPKDGFRIRHVVGL